MYKRDFVELAHMLRTTRENIEPAGRVYLDELTYSIAVIGKRLNNRFSFDRFYTAANYKGHHDDQTKT